MFRNLRTVALCTALSATALADYTVFSGSSVMADDMPKMPAGERHGMNGGAGDAMAPGDIIDVATGPGMEQVTTVVAAIKAAGLVDTLKGKGPFTVFAPTNEAFGKLPAGTVDTLLKPENKDKLKSILLYHVHVGDAIKAGDAKTMNLSTAEGSDLKVVVDGGNVMINNAKVIKADVPASNGEIHWIDTVLMPPAKAM